MFKRKRSTYRKKSYNKKAASFYAPKGKKYFGRPARPELKTQSYVDTAPINVNDTGVSTMLYGSDIRQGIGQGERIGNRITGKFFSLNMLLKNNAVTQGAVLRYVIYMTRNSSVITPPPPFTSVVDQINTTEYRVLKQGWVALKASEAKVIRISRNLRNRVINYSSDGSNLPVGNDRVHLALVSSTGDVISYQQQCKFWYADA